MLFIFSLMEEETIWQVEECELTLFMEIPKSQLFVEPTLTKSAGTYQKRYPTAKDNEEAKTG